MHIVHCKCGQWHPPGFITRWNALGIAEECVSCWAEKRAKETVRLIPAATRQLIREAFKKGSQ